MTNIVISGINGHLGQAISKIAANDNDIAVTAGIARRDNAGLAIPVFLSPLDCDAPCDVLIDVSAPAALPELIRYAELRRVPLVLCVTGYSEAELDKITKLAEEVPVFRSGNMSLGINLLMDLVRRAASALGPDFDIEIVDRHHRRKADAPSGTALMLANAASEALWSRPEYVFDRSARRTPRPQDEIGLSSIRGGTIVGEHEVIFAGQDEVIELRHTAYSRDVFAAGAIRAAKYIADVKKPGLYDMRDVIG